MYCFRVTPSPLGCLYFLPHSTMMLLPLHHPHPPVYTFRSAGVLNISLFRFHLPRPNVICITDVQFTWWARNHFADRITIIWQFTYRWYSSLESIPLFRPANNTCWAGIQNRFIAHRHHEQSTVGVLCIHLEKKSGILTPPFISQQKLKG